VGGEFFCLLLVFECLLDILTRALQVGVKRLIAIGKSTRK